MHMLRCFRPAIAGGLGAAIGASGRDWTRERFLDQGVQPVELYTVLWLAAAVALLVYLVALSYPSRAAPACCYRPTGRPARASAKKRRAPSPLTGTR